MNKRTKAILVTNYDRFCSKPENAGLHTIYNAWSDKKQRIYDEIKNKLKTNFVSYELKVTAGNTYFFICAAKAKDNYDEYFMVWTPSNFYCCFIDNGKLLDENGEIFYS